MPGAYACLQCIAKQLTGPRHFTASKLAEPNALCPSMTKLLLCGSCLQVITTNSSFGVVTALAFGIG